MIMFDRYCFSFQIQSSQDGELRSQVSYIRTATRDKLMLIILNCQDFIPGHVLRVVARREKKTIHCCPYLGQCYQGMS